jgi:hypothetical protein
MPEGVELTDSLRDTRRGGQARAIPNAERVARRRCFSMRQKCRLLGNERCSQRPPIPVVLIP